MEAHTTCVFWAVGVIGFRSGCSLPALARLIDVAELDQKYPRRHGPADIAGVPYDLTSVHQGKERKRRGEGTEHG